uniref:Uncharacterized protein n=1 Tax=viral metagenome TaxID=1070528 RepID=A0A6M3LJ73_9ZZZZ
MNKRKKIVLLVALCLIFMFITAARYSAERPPQWLLMIASDTFGWRLSDSSAVIRMQVDTDGSLNVYNAAGTKTWGISTAGIPEAGIKMALAPISGTSYSPSSSVSAYTATSAYNLYLVRTNTQSQIAFPVTTDAIGGVSFYLPTGSEALDGYTIKIAAWPNADSFTGTSDICIVPANDAKQGKGVTDWIVDITGTTGSAGTYDVYTYDVVDNEAESVTYRYTWGDSTGGTWYQIDTK